MAKRKTMTTQTLQTTTALHSHHDRQTNIRVIVALITAYLIWGSTYLAIDVALHGFPPFAIGAVRFTISGLAMLLVALARGEKLPNFRLTANAALIGILTLGIGTGSIAIAEQWVSTGLSALAVAAVPLWTAIFAAVLIKHPSRMEWFGLAIGFTGIVLLNMDSSFQAQPLGAIALIVGPLTWSLGSILSQKIALPKSIFMVLALEMLGAGVFSIITMLVMGQVPTAMPSLAAWGGVFYLAFFGSFIGFSAYMYLLNTVSPVLATSYAYVNPIVAVLLGILFLGEVLIQSSLIAMVIILAGVVIVVIGRSKRKVDSQPVSELA